MIKNPKKTKADFSKLLAEGRILVEKTGKDFFVAGPGGVWIAFEKADIELSDIATRKNHLEVLLKYDGELVQPKAGSLRQWHQLGERNVRTLERRHKAHTRVDYYHHTNKLLKAGYFDNDSGAEVSVFFKIKTIKINFKLGNGSTVEVWRSKMNNSLSVRATYVLTQLLRADSSWQDPRPWLTLLERFPDQLEEDFRRNVYLKLIKQYQTDQHRSDSSKYASVSRLRADWSRLSRTAWWEVNNSVLIDILKGAELFKPAEQNRLFAPLMRDVDAQTVKNQNEPPAVENSWFSSWLPVGKRESHKTLNHGWPLSVAECLRALGYNGSKVQDDK